MVRNKWGKGPEEDNKSIFGEDNRQGPKSLFLSQPRFMYDLGQDFQVLD